MRTLLGIPQIQHNVYSKVGVLSDVRVAGCSESNTRVGPVLADQRVHQRFLLKRRGTPGSSATIDLSSLELTNMINLVSSGPFRMKFILADMNKNHDRQTIPVDGQKIWALDDSNNEVEPWLYCAKQFSVISNNTFTNWTFATLDPTIEPNVMGHSYVSIDFNEITNDWDNPPTNGVIRITSILNNMVRSKFDIELYADKHTDPASRKFRIHSNEPDQTDTPAQRTALDFARVFAGSSSVFWESGAFHGELTNSGSFELGHPMHPNLSAFESTPLFNYWVGNGVVLIWSKVVRMQPDIQLIYSNFCTKSELDIELVSNTITPGESFFIDCPAMRYWDGTNNVQPWFPIRFTAVSTTPNRLEGEFEVLGSATLTRNDLLSTIRFLSKRENSVLGLYHYILGNATPVTIGGNPAITLQSYYKGVFSQFEVDYGIKRDEITAANGEVLEAIGTTPGFPTTELGADPFYCRLTTYSTTKGQHPRIGDQIHISSQEGPIPSWYTGVWKVVDRDKNSIYFEVDRTVSASDAPVGTHIIDRREEVEIFIDPANGFLTGDVIELTLGPQTVLFEVVASSPTYSSGEFEVGATQEDTRDDLILAITEGMSNVTVTPVSTNAIRIKSNINDYDASWDLSSIVGYSSGDSVANKMSIGIFKQRELVIYSVLRRSQQYNNYFDAEFLSGSPVPIRFRQRIGEDTQAKFEGDIVIGLSDDGTENGWLHPKHHYSGTPDWDTFWSGKSPSDKAAYIRDRNVPRFGIEDPEDGSLPMINIRNEFFASSVSERDPVRWYYFPENSLNRLNHTVRLNYQARRNPYPGRHYSARGISVRLGTEIDHRYGVYGGFTRGGGPSTAFIVSPYGGDTIYRTTDPTDPTIENKFEFRHGFQFVSYFVMPSTFAPPWANVPVGFGPRETIDNLAAAVRSLYSRFHFRVMTSDLYKFWGLTFFYNDKDLKMDETRFSLDYSPPLGRAVVTSSSEFTINRKHVIGLELENVSNVDATLDLLALGSRFHGRGSPYTQVQI